MQGAEGPLKKSWLLLLLLPGWPRKEPAQGPPPLVPSRPLARPTTTLKHAPPQDWSDIHGAGPWFESGHFEYGALEYMLISQPGEVIYSSVSKRETRREKTIRTYGEGTAPKWKKIINTNTQTGLLGQANKYDKTRTTHMETKTCNDEVTRKGA